MRIQRRLLATTAVAIAGLGIAAGPAAAHECLNPNAKASGVQLIINVQTETPSYVSPGLQGRMDRGLVGPDGSGFSGPVGLDLDGDGAVDVIGYQATPGGSLPRAAQDGGAQCNGIVNFGAYLTYCVA